MNEWRVAFHLFARTFRFVLIASGFLTLGLPGVSVDVFPVGKKETYQERQDYTGCNAGETVHQEREDSMVLNHKKNGHSGDGANQCGRS